jgi:hypothetical protein
MRGRRLFAAVVAAVALLGLPARLAAQPVVLLGVQYGAPMRASGGVAVLSPFSSAKKAPGGQSQTRSGLLIGGSIGTDGEQLAAGIGALVKDSYLLTYGFDIRATLTGTRRSPLDATPNATYAGIEAGLTVSLVRVSAGYAHRVSGGPGPKGDRFTWAVGAQFPLW